VLKSSFLNFMSEKFYLLEHCAGLLELSFLATYFKDFIGTCSDE